VRHARDGDGGVAQVHELARAPRAETAPVDRDEAEARAKDLLRTTSLPCEEIASACGICDASSLAHLFRRKFGASPSAFRR